MAFNPAMYSMFFRRGPHHHPAYTQHRSRVIFTGPPRDLNKNKKQELLLQASIVRLGADTDEGTIIEGVTIPWAVLLKELELDSDLLFKISPRKFEELIASAYHQAGWEVELTPPSGDKGRDVIAVKPGFCSVRVIEQAKRYAKGHKVKANDVRALVGVLAVEPNVSKGIVTTTSDFESCVYEQYKDFIPYKLDLRNGSQLYEWLRQATLS